MARKYSSEYKNLQPYVVEDIRKVVNAAGASGGGSVTQGVTDHGALTGLGDDDHPQYLTPVRGDARYIPATRQVIAGSGMTGGGALTADVTLALTTPGTLTVSSTNVATGSHTHAITASSDVGTSPAAALLKSTAGGALTLSSLFVKGSVSLTNNGDLTVAGSGSYAGNTVLFADSSGGNVGIMMTPDPQFALDVNGPARATYFIGPHALQLKNVLLLSHFDGRAPYATNFSGEPNGHMGQVATVAGGVIYRPGKFYKAAQFSHAVTNLVTNPRFGHASYLTGWLQWNTPTVVATSEAYIGTTAAWVQSAGAGAIGWQLSGLTNGTIYTATVYARYGTPTVYLANGSFGNTVNATWTDVGDGWFRAVATRTVTADGYMTFVLPGTSGGVIYSNAQIELRNFPTPYADGDMGDGHAWTGTAHASTSTRTAATLTYPTSGNISATKGTVMAWVWVDGNDTSTQAEAIIDAGSAWPYCALYLSGGVTPTLIMGSASGNTSATGPAASGVRQWVHVAATWTGSTMTVYTNGVAGTPVNYTYAPTLHTAIRVGYLATLGNRQLNGYIDDLCILERAMPAAEIRSVYESNAPVFAETSTFSFRPTPKGLIWADDEGLWMRATDGDTVLGIYGNDAQTKSWGGQTMSAGDLLIGNASNYVFWDDSAATLSISGSLVVGSTNKIWLNEANDGVLAIGGSTKASAPFRVTAAGALTATSATVSGSIGATGGGVLSGNWYVGYDGTYAGSMYFGAGGKARVGTNGLSLVMENLGSSPTISTSSSALRWFPDVSESYSHTAAKNCSGIIGYKHTGYSVVDNIWDCYVGSTDYGTYAARIMLQAGHMDGSSVYTGARLEVVREAGSGLRYVGIYADRLEVNGAIGAATMTAPGASWASGSLIYTDTADGDLKVRFANGVVKTLATN